MNLILYPVLSSVLLSLSLIVFGFPLGKLLFSICGGVLFAVFALLFAFAPMVSPLFQELDIQFFLISVGVVLGALVKRENFWIGFWQGFSAYLSDLLVLFVVVSFITLIFKYLSLGSFHLHEGGEELMERVMWIVSVSCAISFVPVAYFYLRICGAL